MKLKDTQYFENMAHILSQGATVEIAMIRHKGQVFYAVVSPQKGPSSAVVKLIQGIFDLHRDHSFFILRNRIWTTEPLGPMALGMVRVAAKRISQIHARGNAQEKVDNSVEVGPRKAFVFSTQAILKEPSIEIPHFIESHEQGRAWASKIAQSVRRGEVLHDHNRAIGAILCGPSGQVLEWSSNSAALNKTLHAEVRMTQKYFERTKRLIPVGARIYVSLKPCQMCAGLISESCEDLGSIRVYYSQNDNGPLAQRTALENNLIFVG